LLTCLDADTLIIEGLLVGDVAVNRLELREKGTLRGNVSCKSLDLGPRASMFGQIHIDNNNKDEEEEQRNVPLLGINIYKSH
jgi:cytoskeletal protein CcmA (bactofilin family)